MIHASGECTALAVSTDATTHLLFTSFVHEGSQSDESWLKANGAKTARLRQRKQQECTEAQRFEL